MGQQPELAFVQGAQAQAVACCRISIAMFPCARCFHLSCTFVS